MDDPAFMLLQLQENLQFMRTQFGAHVLSCVTHDSDGEPYWTYVLLTYDNHGNVQEYHDPCEGRAEWTNQPLEALKQLHLRVAGFVTKRLVHDCYPRLRTLAQQRYDDEVEHDSSGADNYPNQAHRSQPGASSSSRITSELLNERASDPPSYQTQDSMNTARPSHKTLSSGTRTEFRKRQQFEDGRTIQPQQLGPAHLPQPSPALGSETWGSMDTNSQVYRYGTLNSSGNNSSISQEDYAPAQSARSGSTQTRFRTAEPNVNSSAFETKPARQTNVNPSILPLYGEAHPHSGARSNLSGIPTQADKAMRSSRSQLSRSAMDTNLTPPWISNMRMPSNSNVRPPANTSGLPQPLGSHPPPSSNSIMIMMDPETLTEFEEFRRRSGTQQHRELNTLDRIEQEAAEYLNQDTAAPPIDEKTLSSLAARLRDYGIKSPESDSPASPASDETVTAYNPAYRRRRVTQRRYNSNQTEGPLPPPAPSPPQNTYYPSNVPVYPPSIVTARSEASMQRAPSIVSARNNRVPSTNASTGRNVSFGEGSVVRQVPQPTPIELNSDEEGSPNNGDGGRGTRYPSAQRQQSTGEQVRFDQSPLSYHPLTPIPCSYWKKSKLTRTNLQQVQPRGPRTFNARARNTIKAVRRTVSDTISGRRFASMP